MKHKSHHIWFQNTTEISVSLAEIKTRLQNPNQFNLETIRLTPGITKAEIVRDEPNSVTIVTNEATIVRSNIVLTEEPDSITVTFEEKSRAGKLATIESNHRYHFEATADNTTLTVTVSDMRTAGILGYLYKTFGARSNGNAIVNSLKKYLTQQD